MENEYIIAWSGGKDSTASILLAIEHNIPIKEIVTFDVMYDNRYTAVPLIDDFKTECIKQFESMGIKCTRLTSKTTYKENFLKVRQRGKTVGKCRGHVLQGMCDFTGQKMATIKKYCGDTPQIIGIAIDEPERLTRIKDPNISLLAQYNMTEHDAMKKCEQYGMVSPLYKLGNTRDGCFFCPNGYKTSLKLIYQYMPYLYDDFKEFVLSNVDKAATDKYCRNMSVYDVFKYIEE